MGDITERVAYVLRIPPLLKVELEGEAKEHGVSLNAYLAGIIEKRRQPDPANARKDLPGVPEAVEATPVAVEAAGSARSLSAAQTPGADRTFRPDFKQAAKARR